MVRYPEFPGLLRPSALLVAAMLGGCSQMSGIGDMSLLGGESSGQANSAEAQVATLTPEETPPLPARRPGKRPRQAPQAAQAQAPASTASVPSDAQEQSAKAESSGLSLASLGDFKLFSSSGGSSPSGPESVLVDQNPLGAYSLLAQRIKYCWLNPSAPRLPNHGFYSDLPAGEVKEAKMIIYEKDADGRRGTTVFKVDITAESDGALVAAQNVRLDKNLEASFKADLARWAKGDDRCKT